MKNMTLLALPIFLFTACDQNGTENKTESLPLTGTWRLVSGATITGKDTVVTDYTDGQQMLKIINDSHFAFIRHDLNQGKDTATDIFSAGAGRYTLQGDKYTEQLDFFDQRQWEGHSFNFTVSISNDTLVQQGLEKMESLGIDRVIIEKYVRVRN